MKLVLDDKTYTAALPTLYRLTIGEAQAIKRHTGLTLSDWRIGMLTFYREDPDVLAGLVFLLRKRSGETVDWVALGEVNAQDVIDGLELDPEDEQLLTLLLPEDGSEGATDASPPPESATAEPATGQENPGA